MADLTTLAENKTYLGIALSDTSQDAIIEIIRPAIEESILLYCDTDFTQKETPAGGEIHDGIQSDMLVPFNFPIISIDAVYLGCDPSGENGTLLVVGTDYYVDADDGSVILTGNTTPFRRGSCRLNYKWGYVAVPKGVKLAVYQCVKAELQRRKRNTEDVSSRGKDGETEQYGKAWDDKTGLPKQILSKLDQYRSREFPQAGMAQRNY
jgi:hypothetical protein